MLFYVKIEKFGQDRGKGSIGMQAWNMGTGAWRWDSDAIFFPVVFCANNFFMGMEQLGYVFLVFFFHIFFK